jgi:lysophospholipase L1-like esterase
MHPLVVLCLTWMPPHKLERSDHFQSEFIMKTTRSALLLLVIAATMTSCTGERMSLRQGERILFLGDSITELGVKPNGYVALLQEKIRTRYPDLGIEIIGAGISGNKVTDLHHRLSKDVIDRKPTIVVIYIGINDVWHWALLNHKGTTRAEFERLLREIVARIQYSGAEVVLCTPSVIGEKFDGTNPQDRMLELYCEIGRKIASDQGVRLCDLRKAFIAYLTIHNKENREKNVLTIDGVHLNDTGNRLVADEMLRFLGEQ